MMVFPEAWLHETLQQCCWANFQFVYRECMGVGEQANALSLNPCLPEDSKYIPEHTGLWYVVYEDNKDPTCVQDCAIGPDCGGLAQYHDDLYDSYDECCEMHLWWVKDSRCSQKFLAGTQAEPSQQQQTKWYVAYSDNGGDPECISNANGLAQYHDDLYDTFMECCERHLWYLLDSPCPLT